MANVLHRYVTYEVQMRLRYFTNTVQLHSIQNLVNLTKISTFIKQIVFERTLYSPQR